MRVKEIAKKKEFTPRTIEITFESLEEVKYTHDVLSDGDDRKTGKIYDALTFIIDEYKD